MGVVEFRLCDEDRQRFGLEDTPEWIPFDRDELNTRPFDQLYAWEKQIQEVDDTVSLMTLTAVQFGRFTVLGLTGVVWLALQLAGVQTPRFRDFNIRTFSTLTRRDEEPEPTAVEGEDDVVPPSDGSSPPSSEPTPS